METPKCRCGKIADKKLSLEPEIGFFYFCSQKCKDKLVSQLETDKEILENNAYRQGKSRASYETSMEVLTVTGYYSNNSGGFCNDFICNSFSKQTASMRNWFTTRSAVRYKGRFWIIPCISLVYDKYTFLETGVLTPSLQIQFAWLSFSCGLIIQKGY